MLVAHSILPGVITLKSAYNKYLAADKFGILNAASEAIGPQQEWTPIFRPEGIAFQSKYEKFLKFEDDRNSLRADSESAGFCEIFHVYCQAARRAEMRKKANQKAAAAKPVTEVEIEAAYVESPRDGASRGHGADLMQSDVLWPARGSHSKRYQSWGMGRVKLADDATDLRREAEEGHLATALLERRAKVKSDKFCK